jgi:hypothetical protein
VAETMTSSTKRRCFFSILLALLIVAIFYAHTIYAPILPRIIFIYGWLLFFLIVILSLYNARKKLPFLPLGTAENWLQFHIYAGLLTIVLFAFHIRFRFPNGWFDGILFSLYWLVTLSGIFGLVVAKVIPKRLTSRGGEALYERIPMIRRSLQEQAETLALKSIPEAQSTTLADFYLRHLKTFFDRPQNFWLHLFEVRSPLNSLVNKIGDLNRFLDEKERGVADKLADLVRQKDGLDYQRTLQITMKAWLFVHIPLTYSLLIFSVIHIVIVFAFSGGAR